MRVPAKVPLACKTVALKIALLKRNAYTYEDTILMRVSPRLFRGVSETGVEPRRFCFTLLFYDFFGFAGVLFGGHDP